MEDVEELFGFSFKVEEFTEVFADEVEGELFKRAVSVAWEELKLLDFDLWCNNVSVDVIHDDDEDVEEAEDDAVTIAGGDVESLVVATFEVVVIAEDKCCWLVPNNRALRKWLFDCCWGCGIVAVVAPAIEYELVIRPLLLIFKSTKNIFIFCIINSGTVKVIIKDKSMEALFL